MSKNSKSHFSILYRAFFSFIKIDVWRNVSQIELNVDWSFQFYQYLPDIIFTQTLLEVKRHVWVFLSSQFTLRLERFKKKNKRSFTAVCHVFLPQHLNASNCPCKYTLGIRHLSAHQLSQLHIWGITCEILLKESVHLWSCGQLYNQSIGREAMAKERPFKQRDSWAITQFLLNQPLFPPNVHHT